MIAGAADQVVEAGALAAQHQNAVAGQVKLVIVRCAPFIEADNPEIFPLQLLESPYQVDDAGDAKVLGGSRAGLYSDRAQRGRTPLGQNDPIHSGSVGNAKEGAQVLRIFNSVESQQ